MKSVILLGHRRVLWGTVMAACLLSGFILTTRSVKLLSRSAAVRVAQGSHFNPAASPNPESRIPNPGSESAAQARLVQSYGKLPLSFEINKGQTDSQVKFLSRGSGYSLFLTGNEAVLALKKPVQRANGKRQMAKGVAAPGTRPDYIGRAAHPGSADLAFRSAAFPGLLRSPAAELDTNSRTADPNTGSALQGLLGSAASFQFPVSNFQTPATDNGPRTTDALLRMKLVGANPNPKIVGTDELPGKSNYFIGNDPKKWRANVPNYAKVKYAEVYPGVDLVYYGNQGKLEYDFVVQPGGDPNHIILDIGAGLVPAQGGHPQGVPLRIDGHGDLVVGTDGGEIIFHKPVVYQPATYYEPRTKNQEPVEGKYAVKGDQVSFEVASYDKRRPLVIDPVLAYSTYLGGSYDDIGYGIAVDASGNAYVTGYTGSSNFPTTSRAFQTTLSGPFDVFVTKLNPTGSALLYSTYLGGTRISIGYAVAVNASGEAHVVGRTYADDFPTTAGAFQTISGGNDDVIVSKLNATGSALLYSTYLGGPGYDHGYGIALDASGNAYVTGYAEAGFPTTPGAFQTTSGGGNDVFVSKLNATGSALVYSTYLGGSDDDSGSSIAIDASGNAYVAGVTTSTNFPATPGAYQTTFGGGYSDGFVSKLNAAGAGQIYSTYLGGGNEDYGSGITVDASGNAVVTGGTSSSDFPTTPGALQTTFGGLSDAFVTKLSPAGSALIYSTYLGGSGYDTGHGIAVNASGTAYVTGETFSTDFPLTVGAFQLALHGPDDAFVSKLDPTGSALLYSTYLGGSGQIPPTYYFCDSGFGVAVDASGNAYVTGSTCSSDFPTTRAPFQTVFGGYVDAFVSKFSFATGGVPAVALTPASVSFPVLRAVETTSFVQKVKLFNVGTGDLDIGGITVTGPDARDFAQSNNCTPALAGGASCLITVTFTPTAQGVRTASVSIKDSATGSPQTVPLSGRGTFFEWSPRSMYMGVEPVGTSSPAQTVKLTNVGPAPITIFSIEVAGVNPGDFTQTNTCGSGLNPGASCTIQVTFTPTAVGDRLGRIAIHDSAFGGTHLVGLLGKGT